ncbi:MAG TPA: DUF2961 domain-containing protein [bacterium]|nr:DUF2961 domain-containing protein [bacterium]
MNGKALAFLLSLFSLCAGSLESSYSQQTTSRQPNVETTADVGGLLSQTCLLREFRSKRSSSWDQSGGNQDWLTLPPGENRIVLNENQAGCIKHIYWVYIEGDERWDRRLNLFHGVVLRAFWDGSDKPSIEVPLGDFFGVSNDQVRPIRSLAFTVNPGVESSVQLTWGFNCYLPMPFSAGAKIELQNQGQVEANLWFHIDYELYPRPADIPSHAGRLHAWWNRVNPTQCTAGAAEESHAGRLASVNNYRILDVDGDGQFIGYFLTVVNFEHAWWGEGDDMVFIDGETYPPSIHGTGTEEIFGGGACPSQEYTGPYTGFHCVENRSGYAHHGTNGMYRFYLTDPIRFKKSIAVTLEHGHQNDKANDYSSVAFWYQLGINRNLNKLPPLAERMSAALVAPEMENTEGIFSDSVEVVFKLPSQGAVIHYTLDDSEPTMQSAIYGKPIRLTKTTTVKARAFKSGRSPSATTVRTFTKAEYRVPENPPAVSSGLHYSYFEGEWNFVSDFLHCTPLETGCIDHFDFSPVRRIDHFGLKFSGLIDIPVKGIYTFYLMSDDGSRLYIGDQLVVDHDGRHSVSEKSGQIALATGLHAITVVYFESMVHEILRVYYAGPGIEKQPIPARVLFREKK